MVGNVVSVGYAVIRNEVSVEGRRIGLSEHPNVFGLCALLAVALIPFILTQVPRSWRWIPLGLGAVCMYGVWISGSRAALAALIAVAVIYPVLARSVLAGLALIAGFTAFLAFAGRLLGETSSSNALGRLLGAVRPPHRTRRAKHCCTRPSTSSWRVRFWAMVLLTSSPPT